MDKAKTLTATAIFSLLLVRVLAGSHMDSDLLYPDPTPKPARQPDIILAQAMATPEPGATGTKPGSIKAPHANVTPGHVTLLHTPEKSSTSKTSRTALNPQPLPPLKSGKPATGNSTSKTSKNKLNPQPLPP